MREARIADQCGHYKLQEVPETSGGRNLTWVGGMMLIGYVSLPRGELRDAF